MFAHFNSTDFCVRRQWFEEWLATFRKHWLSWRAATSTATTVDKIYELWQEGCSRAGVPADLQAKFEESVRQFGTRHDSLIC